MLTFIRKLDALDIAPKDLYSEKIATMDALLREIVGHFSDLVTSRFPDKKLKEANRVIKKSVHGWILPSGNWKENL
jgi:hypothetical protein